MGTTGRRVFWQQRVYRYIRRNGPVTAAVIARDFGATTNAASKLLGRMVKNGSVTAIGAARNTRYVATTVKPEDMRGTSVGRQKALDRSTILPNNRNRGRGAPGENVPVAVPPPLPTLLDLIAGP